MSPTPPPPAPAELRRVRDAALTVVEKGRLRTDGWPSTWMRGAVYDAEGELVDTSQRLSISASPVAAADPDRYPGRRVERLRRLSGTWLYGGHWVQHFGHFILETLPTLWPRDLEGLSGLVFHKYLMRSWSVQPYMQRLLDLAGYPDLPVEMVGQRGPLAVEGLVVPSRSFAVLGWARPEAVTVWDRVVAGRDPAGQRRPAGGAVFLSRTAFNADLREQGRPTRSSAARDSQLDDLFAARGFEVVSPETLAIDEQLDLAASADVLAGVAGSALHLSAFAPSSTRVVEIADARTRDRPNPTQLAIDAARGRRTAFFGQDVSPRDLQRGLKRLLP